MPIGVAMTGQVVRPNPLTLCLLATTMTAITKLPMKSVDLNITVGIAIAIAERLTAAQIATATAIATAAVAAKGGAYEGIHHTSPNNGVSS